MNISTLPVRYLFGFFPYIIHMCLLRSESELREVKNEFGLHLSLSILFADL